MAQVSTTKGDARQAIPEQLHSARLHDLQRLGPQRKRSTPSAATSGESAHFVTPHVVVQITRGPPQSKFFVPFQTPSASESCAGRSRPAPFRRPIQQPSESRQSNSSRE